MRRILILLLTVLALAACASSALVTGQPRPPIDPSQVRVYFSAPPGPYEEIARLQTGSGAFTYGEQNKMNSVIAKLRNEAAKLGANGVLFTGTEDGGGGSSVGVGAGGGRIGGHGFSGGGVGVSISPTQKYAYGLAIYVPNPPPAQYGTPQYSAPAPQPRK